MSVPIFVILRGHISLGYRQCVCPVLAPDQGKKELEQDKPVSTQKQ